MRQGALYCAVLVAVMAAGVAPAATPSTSAATPAACTATLFPLYGKYVPSKHLHGPALILNGGGALEGPLSEWKWAHDYVLGRNAGRAGNVLVLRAYDANIYDKIFYNAGDFASVQTALIPPCAPRSEVDRIAAVVDRADIVFFAGGDQANYTRWKGSALIPAIRRVYARGGAVGGGSAGLAVQGAVIYDAVAADRVGNDTHTADAVKYPLEPRISFTTGFFAWPPLADTITDTHVAVRDRFGRTVVFLARILQDRILGNVSTAYALAVDQASVVLVGREGIGTVVNGAPPGVQGAWLIRATGVPHVTAGSPIRYAVDVSNVRAGDTIDLLHKTTHNPWYRVVVDGSKTPPYDRNPYKP